MRLFASPSAGLCQASIRSTRAAAVGTSLLVLGTEVTGVLVNNLDPKLVAAAFGMTAEGVLTYFADRVAPTLEAALDDTVES